MQTDLLKPFRLSRDTLLKAVRPVSKEDADAMPNGFANTIRWNVGHVLTSADRMFAIAGLASQLPAGYPALFATGTSQAGWPADVPPMATLISALERQQASVRDAFSRRLEEKLAAPLPLTLYEGYELHTIGELVNFFAFHEAMHLGYVNALKRAIAGRG